MTFEEWYGIFAKARVEQEEFDYEIKAIMETCWNDAVLEGRNIQAFKDYADMQQDAINYEDWNFNPMTGKPIWGEEAEPVKPSQLADASLEPVAWWNGKETVWFEHELITDGPVGECSIPLYAAPVSCATSCPDAKAILETERKRHAFELSMQEELFADKAEAIRAEALEEAAKVCDSVNNYDNPMTATDCAAAIRGLK